VAFSRGNFVQARLFYTEALQMARQYNDTERITTLLCHLGDAIHAQGDYQQAEDFLREGLLFARQYDYQALKSRLLASLGQVTYRAARPELAIEYFQEGLALAQKLGHRQLTSLLLTHLGTTYMFQARIPLARVHFQEALVLSRQIGHREQICGLLLNLATISGLVEADYPQTKRYLQEGIELARQAELYDRLSMLLSVFGLSAGFAGDPEQANLYCAEGLELARREGSPYTLGWSLTNWAEVHVKFGQFDAAAAACEETLALSEKANMGTDMQIVAKAQFLLAKILALRGQVAQARELGNKAIAILEQMKHIRLIEVKTWMAQLPESDETSPAG
jgi:tetratricopeptide (TPR) repeat protein